MRESASSESQWRFLYHTFSGHEKENGFFRVDRWTMKHKLLFYIFSFFAFLNGVSAHCPLCTAGVAAAAGGALWLGVQKAVVGLFVGAFAVSTGWWVSKLVKKQYVPRQKAVIIVLSFLLTVLPLYSLLSDVYPLYITWGGEYGSLFNRTYVLNSGIISTF